MYLTAAPFTKNWCDSTVDHVFIYFFFQKRSANVFQQELNQQLSQQLWELLFNITI